MGAQVKTHKINVNGHTLLHTKTAVFPNCFYNIPRMWDCQTKFGSTKDGALVLLGLMVEYLVDLDPIQMEDKAMEIRVNLRSGFPNEVFFRRRDLDENW